MHDIRVHEISLSDDQRMQRQMSKDKMRFNWESLPTAGFIGLVLAVSFFIIGKCFWEADIGILYSMAVGGALGTGLGYVSERRRHKLMPEAERRWNNDYVALCDEIEKFSERLEAFRQLDMTLPRDMEDDKRMQEVQRALHSKYRSEREVLAERMRVFRHDIALKRYEAAVAKNTDSRFRDTRDVTEEVFVRRVRVAHEETEINALTAKEESPNEAEFRELEARFRDEDEPVSTKARRNS